MYNKYEMFFGRHCSSKYDLSPYKAKYYEL